MYNFRIFLYTCVYEYLQLFKIIQPILRDIDRLQKVKKAKPRAADKIRQRLHQAMNIETKALLKALNFGTLYLLKKLSAHSQRFI